MTLSDFGTNFPTQAASKWVILCSWISFFSCIFRYRTEFIILTPKFMPLILIIEYMKYSEISENIHLSHQKIFFVYISFKYFLLSFYNTNPFFFLHSENQFSRSIMPDFSSPIVHSTGFPDITNSELAQTPYPSSW